MMQTVSFDNICDFHCWVIKYDKESGIGRIYIKDSLKDSSDLVPLLLHHNHCDPQGVIGCATLEHRDEGVYAHCKLFNTPMVDAIKPLLMANGSVSLSPFITKIKRNGNNIIHGKIVEVSLVPKRIDQDEAYFPIMAEKEI